MKEKDLALVRLLWEENGFFLTISDSIPELTRMIKQNPKLCFVMETEEEDLIGAVLGGFDGRRGWVHHLAIKKEHQNQGLGKEMMNTLTSAFESLGVVKIKLEVLESNKNVIKFYKKLGWDLRSELTTMSLDLPITNKN